MTNTGIAAQATADFFANPTPESHRAAIDAYKALEFEELDVAYREAASNRAAAVAAAKTAAKDHGRGTPEARAAVQTSTKAREIETIIASAASEQAAEYRAANK